eukprot:scaffold309_cov39-Phaeocystis_antarctica.AAC.1
MSTPSISYHWRSSALVLAGCMMKRSRLEPRLCCPLGVGMSRGPTIVVGRLPCELDLECAVAPHELDAVEVAELLHELGHDRVAHLGAPVGPLFGRAVPVHGDDDGRVLLGPARRLHLGNGGVGVG